MPRYLRLLWIQIRMSLLLSMQYRLDFLVDAVLSLFWTASAVAPLVVLFSARQTVSGWTWPEALLVVAAFTTLKGVLEGAIQPSIGAVVEHVRKGTLDFILMRPVDAQFMVSTARFEPWRGSNVWVGAAMAGWAFHVLGRWPSLGGALVGVALLLAGVMILYAIATLIVSLSFFVVKIDNLLYLFISVYDAARWPASIFRGALAFVFTFILPLAVMTTFPAMAVLGRLPATHALWAMVAAVGFVAGSRLVWTRSIGHYTSAGG